MNTLESIFGEAISVYTRAQAIADGVLVDVSEMAKEAGFRFPVAVTARVWEDVVKPSEFAEHELGQSVKGRLWDVFMQLHFAIKMSREPGSMIEFRVITADDVKKRSGRIVHTTHCLVSTIGPGDTPAPVLTIMFPDED